MFGRSEAYRMAQEARDMAKDADRKADRLADIQAEHVKECIATRKETAGRFSELMTHVNDLKSQITAQTAGQNKLLWAILVFLAVLAAGFAKKLGYIG